MLDLCCGVGTTTVYLSKKGFEATAIDISQWTIEYAREKRNMQTSKIIS
jgi:tRNA/tmRNA/rRNA uracil-C5-methylase (TrmA/RlmC/RlmD family)